MYAGDYLTCDVLVEKYEESVIIFVILIGKKVASQKKKHLFI